MFTYFKFVAIGLIIPLLFSAKTFGRKNLVPKCKRKSGGKPHYVRLRKAVLERIESRVDASIALTEVGIQEKGTDKAKRKEMKKNKTHPQQSASYLEVLVHGL